ncbi:hypothetical protein RSAG8_05756, partial [Rhizoctonia solani AG-8 WAC10335]
MSGLRANQLYHMISYRIPALPRKGLLYLALWVVLALTLPVNFVAPVLTGSITWEPSFNVVAAPTGSVISVTDVSQGYRWTGWVNETFWREQVARQAIGLANVAWGRDSPDGLSKRVLANSVNLRVNSTISNVTLPDFNVSALEWVSNPEAVLTPPQLDIHTTICPNITLSPDSPCPLVFERGALAFIESAPYRPGRWDLQLPTSSIITETRLLALYGAWRLFKDWKAPCVPSAFGMRISNAFPANVSFYPDTLRGQCWLFARVTYTAGVGSCLDCRISSHTTVQADDTNPLKEIRGDRMAGTALRIMPTVSGTLAAMNVSVPSAWENVDNYVVEFLRRSYAVSWTALTNFVGENDTQVNTTYKVALPASQARVNEGRVYIWLAVQSLITISGILFLLIQASLETPVMRDTTLAAFYVNSSEVHEPGNRKNLKDGALIRLRYEDGHMNVKVE